MRTRKTTKLIIAGLTLSLCACGGSDVPDPTCQDAADHMAACTGGVPPGFIDTCTPSQGLEVLAVDCRTLSASAGEVTADGWFGWFLDLEPGQHCVFNFQCENHLVCRPQSEGYWPTDPVCTRRAEENELCDSDDDCYVGLACIGHTRLWENGRCLFPSGKTERHTICNSLLRHMNACEIAAGEKLLDSCLAASDFHKTEEILDLSCARLVALVESGLDFDGDGFITDLGNDRRCFFNFQCAGDLVCRPIEKSFGIYNLADPEDKFCMPLGKEREYCDSTSDCSNGQACMGFSLLGDNGRCLMPEQGESYEKTACRTLRDQLLGCKISVSKSFVASCLVTDHWDSVESYLDMSCEKLTTLEINL